MTRLPYFLSVLLFILLVALPLGTVRGEGGVAVVDVQRVVNESIIGKAAKKNVEIVVSESKVKLSALQSDLQRRTSELDKQASILSKAALEERREVLAKQQRELQRKYQDLQEEIGRRNNDELSRVVKQITDAIEQLAEEKGYVAVFEKDKRVVVYTSPRLDVTDTVIKSLDSKKIAL